MTVQSGWISCVGNGGEWMNVLNMQISPRKRSLQMVPSSVKLLYSLANSAKTIINYKYGQWVPMNSTSAYCDHHIRTHGHPLPHETKSESL